MEEYCFWLKSECITSSPRPHLSLIYQEDDVPAGTDTVKGNLRGISLSYITLLRQNRIVLH
jgi:hypothetical protein